MPLADSKRYPGDRSALLIWHAAELTVTIVCISIPVCRPLWKNWINKIFPEPSDTQASSRIRFAGHGQQQHTIGGSDMACLEDSKGSTPRSKIRKGSTTSDTYREVENDTYTHVEVEIIDVKGASNNSVAEYQWQAQNEQSRNSWATYSPTSSR